MAGNNGRNSRAAPYSAYIMQAIKILKPPEDMTVSEWADKYRVLSPKDSAAPGPWHTSRTPYLKEPMDSFNNPQIQDITFVAGTQLGKTVMEQNMIAYAIDQSPGPMLIVYPTDKLAEFTSTNRLQPMIQLSEPLRKKFDTERSQKLELQFTDMYIALVGANTPSGLSSRPVQYVFFDEIDKFPKWTGNEAGPLELAEERTKTFYNRKIVKVSSPTLKSGNIWQGWEQAEARYQYVVPCPNCGEMQTLIMKNLHWPEGATPAEAREAAEYRCEACGQVIDDRQKMAMLRDGRWKCVSKTTDRPRKIAYHLNSFYSPWLSFGDVAYKFLSAKDRPEKLMNFINSWLAEPWVSKADRMRSDVVMERQLPYERGIVPAQAQILTMGVDVQMDHFWWGLRAWGPKMTSWLVDYGRAETWGDIEAVLMRDWPADNGELRMVNLCCMDSGYRTEEVYYFCAQHIGLVIPTKGSSRALTTRYTISRIDRTGYNMLNLYVFDTGQFKDFISGRLSITAGKPGSWNVYQGIDRRYADMVCSEQKVEHQDKKGHITLSWEPISSHAQNHMLDVETNMALAAEIMGVRYLQEEEPAGQTSPAAPSEATWIAPDIGKDWF